MREDLDRRLCAEFPLLYRDRHGDEMKTCMCWGFPGNGWFHLLHELSSRLEPLIEAQPEDERAAAVQVKEKFGVLCFYIVDETNEMRELIRQAEAKSATVCEHCGIPGERRGGNWIKTLCDWCHARRERERKGS